MNSPLVVFRVGFYTYTFLMHFNVRVLLEKTLLCDRQLLIQILMRHTHPSAVPEREGLKSRRRVVLVRKKYTADAPLRPSAALRRQERVRLVPPSKVRHVLRGEALCNELMQRFCVCLENVDVGLHADKDAGTGAAGVERGSWGRWIRGWGFHEALFSSKTSTIHAVKCAVYRLMT